MALFKIKAYKCEWCGKIFESDRNYHESECKYDPKARTCVSCIFSGDLVRPSRYPEKGEIVTGIYCPRVEEVFLYPHEKYCVEYKPDPNFVTLNKQGG